MNYISVKDNFNYQYIQGKLKQMYSRNNFTICKNKLHSNCGHNKNINFNEKNILFSNLLGYDHCFLCNFKK